jgi:DNA-binding NarL/FixJ family response regulator
MIRVILADDHNILRQGLRALLERVSDIEVVGEADNGQHALELVQCLTPDVIVMDISMPRLNGLNAARRLRDAKSPARIVILSMHADLVSVREALRIGVSGYLLKRSVSEELTLAIHAAMRGETYLTPAISSALLEQIATDAAPAESIFSLLTPREREVLQLIAEGHTNHAIADTLKVNVKTVEKHRVSVMTKLGVRDNAGLVRMAIKHGLIPLEA